jgi:hypothetical protein
MSRFSDDQVRKMLAEYVNQRLSYTAFAKHFNMGIPAARCLLKGVTYGHVERPAGFAFPWPRKKSAPKPRKPKKPPAVRHTPERKMRLLADHVRYRWTVSEFARHAGFSKDAAKKVLSGQDWTEIPRPFGFSYPRHRRLTHADLCAQLLARYVKERLSLAQFARLARICDQHAGAVLRGLEWRDIPRPKGFQYPWPEHAIRNRASRVLTPEQVREALIRRQQEGWSEQRLADHLGIGRQTARFILTGKTYKEVERPTAP